MVPVAGVNADHGGSPNVEVAPSQDLPDTGPVSVTIAATGLAPDTQFVVMQCRFRPDTSVSCDGLAFPFSDPAGAFTVEINVQYTYGPTSECDWADNAACRIVVSLGGWNDGTQDMAEIVFAGHDTRTPRPRHRPRHRHRHQRPPRHRPRHRHRRRPRHRPRRHPDTDTDTDTDTNAHPDTDSDTDSDDTCTNIRVDRHEVGERLGDRDRSPSGIDCGASCAATFAAGSSVALSAAPSASSVFLGWSGACVDFDPCVVTMSSAKAVTAQFAAGTDEPPPPLPARVAVSRARCSRLSRSSRTRMGSPRPSGAVVDTPAINTAS